MVAPSSRRSSRPPRSVRVPPRSKPRIALFVKRSSYQLWVEEKRDPHIQALLAEGDVTVSRLRASHEEHEATVGEVEDALARLGAEVVPCGREELSITPEGFDLVVTVGGDGTLLHASHSVFGVPVLGINSSPSHSVGFFCGARRGEAEPALRAALEGGVRSVRLTRMQVELNGEVVGPCVLNDALFCHSLPAATTRYILELRREGDTKAWVEEQKSSGFWIGPAAGSTAAQRSAGGRVLPLTSAKLQLVVREPYTPLGERYAMSRLLVGPGDELLVRSKTDDGRLFFDGPDRTVPVTRGDVMTFTQSPRPLSVLGLPSSRRAMRGGR
jgi:NAD+ kinase